MKNRKNLMVLALLALFMGVSCADDNNVTTDNNATAKSSVSSKMINREKILALIAKKKEAKAKRDKAFESRDKALGGFSLEELKAKRDKAFESRDKAKKLRNEAALTVAAQ